MAKYLVETYYTCSFKVKHYLDNLNEKELDKLEQRDDGKFEILDVKLDNRKTKNLDKISKNVSKILYFSSIRPFKISTLSGLANVTNVADK